MSERKISLALAMLQDHPELAASTLEQHNAGEVAELLSQIPSTYAAPVLQRMLPQFTARVCRFLAPDTSAALISPLDNSMIASILRQMDKKLRNKILEELPFKARTGCELLLRFSEDTVGAWMTPHVITVTENSMAKEALNSMKDAEKVIQCDFIFVVDRNRSLVGRIHFADLLRTQPETNVNRLIQRRCQTLFGRSYLQNIARHKDWERYDSMPVVNRRQQFIGVLRHSDLHRGLTQLTTQITSLPGQDPASGIFEVYGQTLLALFQSVGDIIETRSANKGAVKDV
ncbi:magnesium transporter MgtE N-terminal domain-containing protein [Emcibacter sp.]|uniref:magnesium transporter MgtE N-terminal domain-containing protein n=1 Tax=Emcibacter sp. TaxID=1979954 RepID=UPI003A8F19A2